MIVWTPLLPFPAFVCARLNILLVLHVILTGTLPSIAWPRMISRVHLTVIRLPFRVGPRRAGIATVVIVP